MNKDKIRELMKEDYIELTWYKLELGKASNENNLLSISQNGEYMYFKPKEKFPIVFSTNDRKFIVDKDGFMIIKDSSDKINIEDSLDTLKEAVDKAIEVRDRK